MLLPFDETARETLARIQNGSYVTAEPKVPRNPKSHRLFFALMNLILHNQSYYKTLDQVIAVFKVACGHADLIVLKNGDHTWIPKSISYASMDDIEFSKFLDRAIDVVVEKILPGVTNIELRQQLEEMTGLRLAA
jgi:hypothetical protein